MVALAPSPFHSLHARIHRQDASGPRTRNEHARNSIVHKERRDLHRQGTVGGGSLDAPMQHIQACTHSYIPIIAKIRLDLQLTCTFLHLPGKLEFEAKHGMQNYLHYFVERCIFSLHFLFIKLGNF